ncbi:DNA-packaging protein [Pseudomonas proteolytica]|uniref:DNA-packaging protein n=1 Tax=Pseudomonas TaxID=286 RepID=UPI0014729C72|nr:MULTISPECIES: DNA-packaging protein [Pseudomonas]NMY85876.1 DNA-packaging protein [Pseudomonas sp. WS 5411]NMZ11686.1 DNA-packaging protein [Pseudomonas proteolytica]
MKGLLDLISPVAWYLALIGVVVFGLHLNRQEGYDEGLARGRADGAAAVAAVEKKHAQEKQGLAEAAVEAAKKVVAELLAEKARGRALETELAETKASYRRTTDKLQGEIARVTTLYRRSLKAEPEALPVGVFTTGFVRVWNEALNPVTAVPATSQPPGGTADSSGTAGAADQLDSRVSQPDILKNHVRNSEGYASCRVQLKSLIEWYTHGRI